MMQKIHPTRLQVQDWEGQAGAGIDHSVTQVPLLFATLMRAKGKRLAPQS